VTEWADYLQLDWNVLGAHMRNKVVVDGRSSLDRTAMEGAGFRFLTVP